MADDDNMNKYGIFYICNTSKLIQRAVFTAGRTHFIFLLKTASSILEKEMLVCLYFH